jgi:hypothetical protein
MEPAIMEQIAMYMTSLPCPPLPMVLSIAPEEGVAQEVICSSHDVLAGLLINAMSRNNVKANEARKAKQMAATRTLLAQCVEKAQDAEEMYGLCQAFTAEYIHSFDDAGTCTPGMRFVDAKDVLQGDKIHKCACAWQAAQDILFVEKARRRNASAFARYTYQELILIHWQRVRDKDTFVLETATPHAE